MAEQAVTLNPAESKLVSFEATPLEARTYQVSVEGLTGSFVAKAAPPNIIDFDIFSVLDVEGISFTSAYNPTEDEIAEAKEKAIAETNEIYCIPAFNRAYAAAIAAGKSVAQAQTEGAQASAMAYFAYYPAVEKKYMPIATATIDSPIDVVEKPRGVTLTINIKMTPEEVLAAEEAKFPGFKYPPLYQTGFTAILLYSYGRPYFINDLTGKTLWPSVGQQIVPITALADKGTYNPGTWDGNFEFKFVALVGEYWRGYAVPFSRKFIIKNLLTCEKGSWA